MQVNCPWCALAVEVQTGAPVLGPCPGCGRPLLVGHSTVPGTSTITFPQPAAAPAEEEAMPQQLGRYRITARLGSGGFGVVYHGRDDELRRDVAIKVPHRHRLTSPQDADVYLTEGRVLASLDHPAIVPVYDVGRDPPGAPDGLCYLVSKFIEGQDLAGRFGAGRPTFVESARILASVAEALQHAHERGLVHRDIKPGNILLDRAGRPYVADFGLALREEDFAQGPSFAGTPAYMSPEQARGEGHRVDARTDVFSAGVVFYELLTGQQPFQGQTVRELLEQITTREAQPPHELDAHVPPELERICLKALAKRASDRYATARELADDLHHWLSETMKDEGGEVPQEAGTGGLTPRRSPTPTPSPPPLKVVPRGLRPFDAQDADFFLELLPGPRDREGLPDSLRFWKTRIDSTEPGTAFTVGLLYGPSGCGKSSLVRAGLLPRLAARVTTVYVEAAPEGTDTRLLGALWHVCPDLVGEMDLPAVLGDLRRGRALAAGRKLLVVLDQFEQFLHGQGVGAGSPRPYAASALVPALRQADGVRLQFLLLVRDDFWLGASRLFQELEVPLVEGHNVALVDLFEPKHARHVLQLFGQAYGCLPATSAEMTPEQRAFLEEAIAGLSQDGKVISVRLSLFADTMKKRPWTPQSLQAVGGTEGVGLTFLQETFSAPTARPDRRALEAAARGVLGALLPEAGSNIKGRIRSQGELLAASGLKAHRHRFARLLDILDRELRIITPTEPPALPPAPKAAEGEEPRSGGAEETEENPGTEPPTTAAPAAPVPDGGDTHSFYQLTHDYLVRPLREWLTQKKRETWRGRAELRLEERTAQWLRSSSQERFLPSPLEYVHIVLAVPRRWYTPDQHALLRAASWFYGTRVAVLLVVAGILGWRIWDFNGSLQGARVAEAIEKGNLSEEPRIIQDELPRYRRWANRRLHELADNERTPPGKRLRASLALVEVDSKQVPYLRQRLLDCSLEEFPLVFKSLEGRDDNLVPELWRTLHDGKRSADERFRAGLALGAELALAGDVASADEWTEEDGSFLVQDLLESNRDDQRDLRRYLAPVAERLLGPLQATFHDPKARSSVRSAAADALADYAQEKPEVLARLVSEATPDQYDVVYTALTALKKDSKLEQEARATLRALLREPARPEAGEQERVEVGRRRAGAAIALLRLGEPDTACEVFRIQQGDPEALTQFIHRLKDRRVQPGDVLPCLDRVTGVPARFALVLALGEFRLDELPEGERQPLRERLVQWYRSDPHSAIHGACGWLLRTWGFNAEVAQVDQTPLAYDPNGSQDWFVEKIGDDYVTFIVFPPGTFLMGSPPSEEYRNGDECQHRVRLSRPFAVADRELTRRQFEPFFTAAQRRPFVDVSEASPTLDHPAVRVTWHEAVACCRWLTQRAGLGAAQCYDEGAETFHPERLGFRLPTEAEWEYACRAGTTSTYSFGSDRDLLNRYGLFLGKQTQRGGTLRPNLRGLFDMHGDAWEWCQDRYQRDLADNVTDPCGADTGTYRVLRGGGWDRSAWHCRSAYRHSPTPDYRGPYMGFRLVKTLPAP